MATRTLLDDNDRPFKTARRTSGDITLNNTSWTDLDTGLDLTLPAAVGDVIEAQPNGKYGIQNTFVFLDAVTVVAGSPVTSFSSGTGTPASEGVTGWEGPVGAEENTFGPPISIPLASGDLSAGTVTVRLRYRNNDATTRVFKANTNAGFYWKLTNLGPQAA
jgi:hypothetical protein